MIQILENDLSVAAKMQVESINNFLHERDVTISVISSYDSVHELLGSSYARSSRSYKELLAEVDDMLLKCISENESLVSASVLDKNFEVLASSVPVDERVINEVQRIDQAYLDGRLHFTPVIESDTGGKQQKVIVIIKGIYEGDVLLGYFVEEMNLSFFEKVRIAVNLFNNGTIYLVDGKKNVITAGAGNDSREDFVTTPEQRRDYMRALSEQDPAATEGILRYEILGRRYVSYYVNFEHAEWVMITSMNVDEILQAPQDSFRLLAVALILLFIACAAVNYLFTHRIVKPLNRIAEKFRRIRDTQDYSIRMEMARNSEIDVISAEINCLLDSVEAYIDMEREKQGRLQEAASTDELTGLYNKRAMRELLYAQEECSDARRRPAAAVYLDIDDFKDFNTKYGHRGGDNVLIFVAQALRKVFDFNCRVGGDEFVAYVMGGQGLADLEERLVCMQELLRTGVELDENGLTPVQCSIGAAVRREGEELDDLLERADQAMYQVKNAEKNNILIEW